MSAVDPAARGKAAGALKTIGELSRDTGLAPHILRYWETRFPQLRPLTRAGNRRYYRPEDVALVRRIDQALNAQGYTIAGVPTRPRRCAPSATRWRRRWRRMRGDDRRSANLVAEHPILPVNGRHQGANPRLSRSAAIVATSPAPRSSSHTP